MFGSGGFFGYYGWFHNMEMGLFKAYSTNRQNAILIKIVGGKKILISPERPAEFLKLVVDYKNQYLQKKQRMQKNWGL